MTKGREFLLALLDKNGFTLVGDKGVYSASSYSGSHGFDIGIDASSDESMIGVFVMTMGEQLVV